MTVLLFLAVLFVLILVHEWGHFIAAKKTDMRVDEFGIGFPPKLYGIKKGETEYTFNLFPIGGFVRILGENATDVAFSPSESEASGRRSEALSAEAGEGGANVKELQNVNDYSRSFMAKSKIAQAIVLVAGVTMNVIFAWFLFVVVFLVGVPTQVDESMASPEAKLMIAEVVPESPAAAAGLTPGTEIVAVSRDGKDVNALTPTQFSEFTRQSDEVMELSTRSGGEADVVVVTPDTGLIVDSPDTYAIGVRLSLVEEVAMPIHKALLEASVTTGQSLVAITLGLTTLITQSVQGTADFSQIAGPVGIVGLVGEAAQFGWTSLLMFTAMISLNLAIINLLPFPALDGGRLVFVAVEAITRRPIKPIWVARLNVLGFILLILLMVAVTYNDILRIL